ncbi:Hypothetical predicted protein [Scomber scombrus]|uniref:Mixed lineage kinase domain-containing protein n=1 Tax=Scomber scombrus TaxID=13677 RepID=A0AAV1Q4P3_SCOSC
MDQDELEGALSVITQLTPLICKRYDQVKNNEERCEHFANIAQELKSITKVEWNEISPELKSTLKKIDDTVHSADKLINKFNNAKYLARFIRALKYRDKFDNLNETLLDVSVQLNEVLCEELKRMNIKMASMERRLESTSRSGSKCIIL